MDALDRLHRHLVDAVRREHGDVPDRPITIAEIYQSLIPYRAVRGDLGFSELAEYEHTLLRLLAGERGYLQVDHPHAQEELQRELRSPSPILGVYRDYAAVGARLHGGAGLGDPLAAVPASRESAPPEPAAASVAPPPVASVPAGATPPGTPPSVQPPVSEPTASTPQGAGPARPSAARAECWHCGRELPRGRNVRYCPFCRAAQQPLPCEECGTPLQPGWSFCIRCGHAQGPADLAAGSSRGAPASQTI